jgi:hypothetical protein
VFRGLVVVQNAASLVSLVAEQLRDLQGIEVVNVPQLLFLEFPILGWMGSIEIGGSPMTGDNLLQRVGEG